MEIQVSLLSLTSGKCLAVECRWLSLAGVALTLENKGTNLELTWEFLPSLSDHSLLLVCLAAHADPAVSVRSFCFSSLHDVINWVFLGF